MSTFKYFIIDSTTTMDDLTTQHHELAKIHHPDKGGPTQIMQEINGEYLIAVDYLSKQPSYQQALGKIDSSGRQFLIDLIDGIAYLLKEAKKYPDFVVNVGVFTAKGIVNTIDTNKWTSFILKIIQKHQK